MEHKKKRWWFNFFSCERGREGEIGVEGEVTQKGRWSLCVRLREKNLRNSAWIGRISGGGGGESEEGGIAATCCHALSGRFSCVPPRLASLSHALILRNTGKTSSHLNIVFFFIPLFPACTRAPMYCFCKFACPFQNAQNATYSEEGR